MQSSHQWQQFQCISPSLIKVLQTNGFNHPTPIQSQVFQNYKHYYEFLIASQTGSGKTIAFAAPIISQLLNLSSKSSLPNKTLCLIITPTRQLAQQISGVIDLLIKNTDLKHACILGGLSITKQLRVIQKQLPHIIIATPGRLNELITENDINIQYIKYLIVDQADRMIQLGHYRQLDEIFNKIFQKNIQQQYFDKNYHNIVNNLKQINEKFYVINNKQKKNIMFNINHMETEKLFQVPINLFQMEQQLQIDYKTHQKQQKNKSNIKILQQNNNQKQQQSFIKKQKKKIFFISATLTKQFIGTKYYTKKSKSQHKHKQLQSQHLSQKNQQDNTQQQYIPKLKALLSRIKTNLKPKIIDQTSLLFLPSTLKQHYCFTTSDIDKITTILCYIISLPPNSKIIIFSNTIRASKRIKYFISSSGFKSLILHSHMLQKHRLSKLQQFKKSSSTILISTDLAARGLDFQLTHVIQYSVPINGDTYIHRVGRTARANNPGQSLILISQKDIDRWQDISKIIQTVDTHRNIYRYCPLSSLYKDIKIKVDELEWIRINEEKLSNKRIYNMNLIQAEQFGVQIQDNTVHKSNKYDKQQDNNYKQQISNKIHALKNKNNSNYNQITQSLIANSKKWKKNKLIMSVEQIKKYL